MVSRLGIFSKKEGLDARLTSSRLLGFFWAGIIFLTAGLIHAQLINVDFNNNSYGTLNGRPGPNPGPTMSGAAVLGTVGDQWNGINSTNGNGLSLFYANGSASTVTMTFTSGGGYDVKNFGGPYPFTNTPYASLMEDYLYTLSSAKTITLSDLATNATYNLVLYNAADNGAAGRVTSFTVNGNTQSSTWNGTSSTLIAGVDYVDFASALSDGSGNLVITYNGSPEGDIDGFQLQGPTLSVTITNPANNSVFFAPANVNTTANAGGGSGTVTNVQFFTNGVSLGSVLTTPFSLTASNLTAGAYTLTAVATAAGISATSAVVNITVVGIPTVSITNPAGGSVFTAPSNVNIAARATESGGTVTNVQFFTNGVSLGSILTAPFSLTASNLAAGTYTLTAVATAAGISATSSVVNVSVISPPPTVTITNPASGAVVPVYANVNISADAEVSIGAVTNVQFFTNGVSLGSVLTAPFSITASNLTVGPYYLTSVATAAGISATSSVVIVTAVYPAVDQMDNTAAYTWTTFAGRPLGGSADGIGSNAQFYNPSGVAVDTNGNVYVADSGNNEIRKLAPSGFVSTIAGFPGIAGTNDGVGGSARFDSPSSIAIDPNGNLYVADSLNNTIRKLTPVGTNWMVSTIAGLPQLNQYSYGLVNGRRFYSTLGGSADGNSSNAQFFRPSGIAVDSATNVYVVDSGNNEIRKIMPVGTNWMVSTIAGNASITNQYGNPVGGYADGMGTNALFNNPLGIMVDSATNIYVTDGGNGTIRKIKPMGANWVTTTLVTNIYGIAIAIDSMTNLYVTGSSFESGTIEKITPVGTNWVVSTFAGSFGVGGDADGIGTNALFNGPSGIALDSAGNLYVADTGNGTIRKVTSAAIVKTLAGSDSIGSSDGTGSAAQFDGPDGMAADANGNLYVADYGNYTIRQVTSAGVVTTVAGLAGTSGRADGVGSEAQFYGPTGVAVDKTGNLYVADVFTIRKITPAGVVSTIAGFKEVAGTNDGIGSNARFNNLGQITIDTGGNLYVADGENFTIRKIASLGTNWVVSTIAGSPGNIGTNDGVGSNARFGFIYGLTVDSATNLYITDSGNATVRKIAPLGTNWIVSTIAGRPGLYGYGDGNLLNQAFELPEGIAVDIQGNIYVTDTGGDTIREITPVGTILVLSTIGGSYQNVGSANGAGSAAQFNSPDGIVVDNTGNIYVADGGNNEIRRGVFTPYVLPNETAFSRPPMNGQLKVTLLPPSANGQWRFPWEVTWRTNGQTASNLVAGNYPVQFRSVPGWLAIPASLTDANSVAVTNGGTTYVTNQYYPTISTVDTNSGGTLTVTLGPSPPSGAFWGFLGDGTPCFPSGYSTNLVAGTYLIQFATVGGRVTPPNLSVQVQPGQTTYLSENYLLSQSAPSQVLLPYPVPGNVIGDVTDSPFGFNGQLQSDVGYGSGVAVQTNVVLTAAHMVFNDQTLSYVSQAYWYFQEETGVFQPEPLAARGWYVLSGYAAQRTNDLQVYAPGTSTPQSRNMDVAALYFLSPVAGGGYGGYLPSDATPNPWLTGYSLKMLVGYPVDGSEFGDATIVPGEMYQTQPQPYALSLSTDSVNDQQEVYVAPWFLAYPGNSGGPVYAQFNGYYYPAGVYLGTLYSGVTPYASAVRAIDSAVVNLITNAAALGDSGTNHTGGGVITFIPNQAVSVAHPGYLQFLLGPPAAVAAGAAWELQGDTNYSTATNYTRVLLSTNAVVVQFKPIAGWNLPANQAVSVVPAPPITIITNALYTVINPSLVVNGMKIGITGTTGTVYVIQRRSSLTTGSWLNVSTNTITSGGFNLLLPNPTTNGPVNFYRAVWLP